MALIDCPGCGRRVSDKSAFCAHCELPLGEMSAADISQLERRRWRTRVWRAKNVTYLAMTALVVGALLWWLIEPAGWVLPPPIFAVVLIFIGAVAYLGARGWLLWLQMKRNRPN